MLPKDDYAVVLDFLPRGHATGRPEPIAQVLGDKYFSLLELVVKKETAVANGERVYIGDDKRDKVDHIKRRITTNDLTPFARSELPFLVEKIVNGDEQRFVDFFNNARPISTRLHQLEMMHGIGKKHLWSVIEERKKEKFKTFADLQTRVKFLPDMKKAVIQRILDELEERDRHRLFLMSPPMKQW